MRDNLKDKIYGNISYNTNEIISKANTIAIMSCGIGASLLPHTSDSLLASLFSSVISLYSGCSNILVFPVT